MHDRIAERIPAAQAGAPVARRYADDRAAGALGPGISPLTPSYLLALQRIAGNTAVCGIVQRAMADAADQSSGSAGSCGSDGTSPPITWVQKTAGGPVVQRQETSAQPGGPGIAPGNGTTAELRAERERLERERRSLHVSTIEPETEMRYNRYTSSINRLDVLLAERGNSTLQDATVDLSFDGATLAMSGPAGQSWVAVSGRPASTGAFDYSPARQRLEGTGPIPAGTYWIDPTQLVDLSERWFYSWRYKDAWGSHRITIHPFDSTQTFGRGGFFVHGGTTPGSAGCIDLTSGMASFAKKLGTLPPGAKVKLNVRYPDAVAP